ncbi:MAG: esterase-like activity of phytase family protein [Pseudomonadota bacterium]
MIRALALALLLVPGIGLADTLRELSRVTWTDRDERFGGLSGMVLSDDGGEIIAISDRGVLFRGAIERRDGRLAGVRTVESAELLTPRGDPLGRFAIDGEGMARAPDGGFYITFEAEHRLRYYPGFGHRARPRPAHPDFARLQNNSGLEALASDAQGRLYAIPERSGALDRPFPVYRFEDVSWDIPFTVPRRPPFLPVGADIGPDGRLYLLERDFQMLGGFSTRLRRFDMEDDGLTNEVTLLETGFSALDNMESLVVHRAADGGLRILMLSDDNFSVFQRTLLVEFAVEESLSN